MHGEADPPCAPCPSCGGQRPGEEPFAGTRGRKGEKLEPLAGRGVLPDIHRAPLAVCVGCGFVAPVGSDGRFGACASGTIVVLRRSKPR